MCMQADTHTQKMEMHLKTKDGQTDPRALNRGASGLCSVWEPGWQGDCRDRLSFRFL